MLGNHELFNLYDILSKGEKYLLRNFEILEDNLGMVLHDEEKLEFVKTSVSWIEGRDIMDACFALNFGYEAPLPWPQV